MVNQDINILVNRLAKRLERNIGKNCGALAYQVQGDVERVEPRVFCGLSLLAHEGLSLCILPLHMSAVCVVVTNCSNR